jgi:hypothetical protein
MPGWDERSEAQAGRDSGPGEDGSGGGSTGGSAPDPWLTPGAGTLGGGSTAPEAIAEAVELIGNQLRVAGTVNLGRHHRLSDFVNFTDDMLVMRDVVLLRRSGSISRAGLPELRVRLDDVAVIGQRQSEPQSPPTDVGVFIEKKLEKLVLLTQAHLISGCVFIHEHGSLTHFVESSHPRWIPMSDVRVRWLSDRSLAARYPFALIQRSQIVGIGPEGVRAVPREAQ